jgi:DNA-binding beta-propeller fold protein YncE
MLLLALYPQPASADGGAPNLAYVAGTSQGISIIDIVQQRVTGTFALAGNPQTLYLSIDGRFLYVTQPALNQMSMIAAQTGQVLCTTHVPGTPSYMTFDSVTDSLFVAGNQGTTVSNIDLSNCQVLHTIATQGPIYGLAAVDVASGISENQLWVAGKTGVTIVDTKTRQTLATIPLPGTPRSLTCPPGSWGYVTTRQGGLYAIDPGTHHVLSLLSGGQFGTMDFDQITGEIYVADSLHHQLDVLVPPDPSRSTPPSEPGYVYHLSAAPQSVAITSDGAFGLVALSTGQVALLDLAGRQVSDTFNVGGDPHFVITGLYPPALGTTPQQAFLADTVSNIAIYLLVALVVLFPLWFVWRRSRKRKA